MMVCATFDFTMVALHAKFGWAFRSLYLPFCAH